MAEQGVTSILDLYEKLRGDYSQRNGEYDLARQRVDGVLWDPDTNPEPHNRYSLSVNYLRPIVEKHVQLLVGRLMAIQVMPVGTDEEKRRHAEKLEGVLYSIWDRSNAQETFQRVAWDSAVLRRGIIYYWWDVKESMARFRYCTPDDFYPEYDGDEVFRCIYVHRRHVEALRRQYPEHADLIESDSSQKSTLIHGQDEPRLSRRTLATVLDYYDRDGHFARVCGDVKLQEADLAYPDAQVPFIDFPYSPMNGDREPKNGIDHIVELVQYLSQLVSQKADIIRTYSNPTVLDKGSGQSAEVIRRAISAEGSVLPVHREGNIEFLNWQGTVPAIDEQLELILDIIFDISGKPRSAFGQTITNQSGVVTNLALTPTLQSNEAHETIWGQRLSLLNRRLLQITEKFGKGKKMVYRGRKPVGGDLSKSVLTDLEFTGEEIGGWYESRIKWPSAIRTDDPVYIQNMLAQLTSNPPALSLYTVLEKLGTEDVEAEIDRILEQLEDPRLHPDRLEAQVGAASMAGPNAIPGELMGVGGGLPSAPAAQGVTGDGLQASASPYREELS